MKASVIGSPISHSLSPFIFSFIAHHEKRDVDYNAIEVTLEGASEFLAGLKRDDSFYGTNVTIPLKEIFLDRIDSVSPEVRALGALNVLHNDGGKIKGYNTDIVGIQKTFEGKNFSLKNKTCLLLGAGGSAKAVTYVLGQGNVSEVIIFNRSDRNADVVSKFRRLFPQTKWCAVSDLNDPYLKTSKLDLVVNSTPLGMTGKEKGLELFLDLKNLSFNQNALAFDLIYTPEHTEFLDVAQKMGLATVGGLGMLIDQALATWKIWVGEPKNESSLHEALRNYLNGILWLRSHTEPLYLTGFMGVGKSSVGKILSSELKREFLDTDQLVEEKAHMSVSEIFSSLGETEFRRMEADAISTLSRNVESAIVSLGGGALMNPGNLKAIHDSGIVIYLKGSKESLLSRINSQGQVRPLLANLSESEQLKKISDLLELRSVVYEKAPIHIDTDELSLKECAMAIISAIGLKRGK